MGVALREGPGVATGANFRCVWLHDVLRLAFCIVY